MRENRPIVSGDDMFPVKTNPLKEPSRQAKWVNGLLLGMGGEEDQHPVKQGGEDLLPGMTERKITCTSLGIFGDMAW